MTAGTALASQAIGDGGRRQLASEWGGPEPAASRIDTRRIEPERQDRRVVPRKP